MINHFAAAKTERRRFRGEKPKEPWRYFKALKPEDEMLRKSRRERDGFIATLKQQRPFPPPFRAA